MCVSKKSHHWRHVYHSFSAMLEQLMAGPLRAAKGARSLHCPQCHCLCTQAHVHARVCGFECACAVRTQSHAVCPSLGMSSSIVIYARRAQVCISVPRGGLGPRPLEGLRGSPPMSSWLESIVTPSTLVTCEKRSVRLSVA
jgi:hypothetical protein